MYVDIHTHSTKHQDGVIAIVNQALPSKFNDEKIIHSTGWHPWHIKGIELHTAKEIFQKEISQNNVVCIGECGLDRCIETTLSEQIPFFKFQLEWAQYSGMPTIVHCVKAYSDLLMLLKQTVHTEPIILHAFHGNKTQIEQLLKYNCFFSFGKSIRIEDPIITRILPLIPQDRLFLETDNLNCDIKEIYKIAATQLSLTIEVLADQIYNNYKQIMQKHRC